MTGLKDRAKRASICLSLKPDAQDWHKVARPIKEETEREILEAFIGACSSEQILIESRILSSNAPKVVILCLSVVSSQLSDDDYFATTPLTDWYQPSRRPIPTLANRQYDGLPHDLRRCWISIAPETCRQMGWPEVAACLADVAATPNYHAPSTDAYPGYIVRFCLRNELERNPRGMGKQWTTVARDQTLVEELVDSHGGKELVFSQLTASPDDDVQTIIEQRNIDVGFASICPSVSKVGASFWVGTRDGPVLLQGLSTPSLVRAYDWVRQLEATIARFDRERGRTFTGSSSGKKAVAVEWIADIFGVALDPDAAAFPTRDDVRAEANADRSSLSEYPAES